LGADVTDKQANAIASAIVAHATLTTLGTGQMLFGLALFVLIVASDK
jgi:hypothetical protein